MGNSKNVNNLRRRRRSEAIVSLGGRCYTCGYKGVALVFHHRDPQEKKFGLSVNSFTKNLTDLQQEIVKCDLLCMNCHTELHNGSTDVW